MSTFDQLQDVLVGTPPGDLAEEIAGRIESLLAACWDDLAGNEGGMTGRKIPGRTEDLKWNPPILTFRIERHGAFVAGSSRAEMQHWEVDINLRAATLVRIGKRQMYSMDARLDVKPLAAEIAAIIIEGREDNRIRRQENTVRVITRELIPTTNKQTTSGRRRRFTAALEPLLAEHGWHRKAAGSHLVFARDHVPPVPS